MNETDEYPKPCLACKGSGKAGHVSCDPGYPKRRKCQACNGTGIAMVVIVVRKEENR